MYRLKIHGKFINFQGVDIIRQGTKHQLEHHEQNRIIEEEKARKANDLAFRQEVINLINSISI